MRPLHTTTTELQRMDAAARRLLDQVRDDLDAMASSRAAERAAWPDREDGLLADRLDRESWMGHNCQLLRDLVYLLAVGDRGAGDVAGADPNPPAVGDGGKRLLEEHHAARRAEAHGRLSQAGYELQGRSSSW